MNLRLPHRGLLRVPPLMVATVLSAVPVSAQIERTSVEAAVGVTHVVAPHLGDRPDVVVDVTGAWNVGGGWVAYVRPWFRRAPTGYDGWAKEIYQAAIQHERRGRVSTRLDLGYLLSPIGIGMMDMRPDSNPVTSGHLSYFVPMPSFERGAPASLPVASSYPLGGVLTASTRRWDARIGVTTSPANRSYVLGIDRTNPSARPFSVVGGGVTPRVGVRIGVAFGAGVYAKSSEFAAATTDRGVRMLSVEGEWAFGYTKVSGEFTRTQLDTQRASVQAMQWFVQGAHTLAPRWFVGARLEGSNAPPSLFLGQHPTLRVSEVALNWRVSRSVTLKNGLSRAKTYYSAPHTQLSTSLVWAARY